MTREDSSLHYVFQGHEGRFDNLTSAAGRRAEQEYNTDSATHREVNSIEVSVKSARLSIQMHVMDWAEAQCEDPEIKAAMDWCCLDKKKLEPWTEYCGRCFEQNQ